MKKKFFTVLFALLFASSTVFAASLSVEPNQFTTYYQVPTTMHINHTAIGTHHWTVRLSPTPGVILQDTLVQGWGQIYNQDFTWTPKVVTDSARLQINSTFGDSALSQVMFKTKYGELNFTSVPDTLWWETQEMIQWDAHNFPDGMSVKIQYKWNNGEYHNYTDVPFQNGYLSFVLPDWKYKDTMTTCTYKFSYPDGTFIKSITIPVRVPFIAMRHTLAEQDSTILHLNKEIVTKNKVIDSLKLALVENDSLCGYKQDSLNSVISNLHKFILDSTRVQLIYDNGSITTVENEININHVTTASIINGAVTFQDVNNNCTYWIFRYDGTLIESHYMATMYKVDITTLTTGAYFFYLKKEDGSYSCYKFSI